MIQIKNRVIEHIIENGFRYELVFGIVTAIPIFLLMLYNGGVGMLELFAVVIVASVAIHCYQQIARMVKYDDERLRKITSYAAMNALFTIAVLIAGALVLSSMGIIPEMSSGELLTMVTLAMILPFFCWVMYYYFIGNIY